MIKSFKIIKSTLPNFYNNSNNRLLFYSTTTTTSTSSSSGKLISIPIGSTPSSTKSFLLSKQESNNNNLSIKTINNEILPLSLSRFAIDTDNFTQYDSEHKAVLIKSIKTGCNVIKSSNESKIVCDVLSDLIDKGEIKRQELVYIKKTKPLLNLEKDLTISNINNQIKNALDELYFESLDVLLLDLNNIGSGSGSGSGSKINKIELLNKLNNEILPHLEYLVENGTIQSYGISSDELLKGDNGLLSVTDLIGNGKKKNNKHLLFFEYPFNIYQNQAIFSKIYNNNQNNLFEILKENSITSLNSSPITYTINDGDEIGRFEMVPNHNGENIEQSLKESFNIAIHMETINPIFKDSLQQKAIEKDKDLIGSLQWAHILVYEQSNSNLNNLWKWRQILTTKIQPKVTEAILSVYGNHIINSWGGNYRKAINQLFDIYSKSLEFQIYSHQQSLDNLISKHTNENLQFNEYFKITDKSSSSSLSMYQKNILLSSIGTDILFESPNTLIQLKSIQSDIKLPNILPNSNSNSQEEEQLKNNLLPSWKNLSNNIIKFINDNYKNKKQQQQQIPPTTSK